MNVFRNTVCAIASVIFTLTVIGFSTSSTARGPFVAAPSAAQAAL